MTVAQPEGPLSEGIRTLEVRWIFPGELETVVAGWFGQFTGGADDVQPPSYRTLRRRVPIFATGAGLAAVRRPGAQ